MDRRSSPLSPRRGFLPLARLPLPPGSHARLGAAARAARVREVLGRALAGQLASIEWGEGRVTLVFEGEGWERALARTEGEIQAGLAKALGRPGLALVVRSSRAAPGQGASPGTRVDSDDEPATAL